MITQLWFSFCLAFMPAQDLHNNVPKPTDGPVVHQLRSGSSCFNAEDDVATWTDWYRVAGAGNSNVYISFKQSYCTDGMLAGYSYYRTRTDGSTPKGWLRFRFEYYDCSGDLNTEGVIVDLSQNGVDDDPGRWFMGHDVKSTFIPSTVDYQQY